MLYRIAGDGEKGELVILPPSVPFFIPAADVHLYETLPVSLRSRV